ncbi:replicative DNA helicase [Mangrovibrevibacter kandeliae]|uniref:replicative DNA helicase n=1 Tax=Mangrovibrevibacter kandeliae TaxID=2968473 RepID=UPI002117EA3A|nr:DnaB-like helicase C-terminal domain-containing protein [Aurantimonas sp. CSK15Z-1]MCQ8781683.1 hypothetical protein [Aurantimonas sp. CSK15Z-1]
MTDRRRYPERAPPPAEIISEEAERAVAGYILANPSQFFEINDRLQSEHFSTSRIMRIWAAMQRAVEKGKSPDRRMVALFIDPLDKKDDTPLTIYIANLIHDVTRNIEGFDLLAYTDTIIRLAQKRALLAALDQARVQVAAADVGTAIEDLVDEGVRALTSAGVGDFDRDMRTYGQWAEALGQRVNRAIADEENGGIGLSPGLKAVEEVIGPLIGGKVYVLAGMSSGGKSALAKSIMESAALDAKRKRQGWLYNASLEMNGEEHAARALSDYLGIPSFKIERAALNRSEVEAIGSRGREWASQYPILIDQRRRMTMEKIRSRMMQVKNRYGLAMAVIDHILLIRGGKKDSLMDRVMEAVIEAKIMAGELGIPILLLAQINEKNLLERPSGWPIASDLFGGASIVQNADVVFFIHRPELVTRKKEPAKTAKKRDEDGDTPHQAWERRLEREAGQAWVFSDKTRGLAGGVRRELRFDGETTTFRDI